MNNRLRSAILKAIDSLRNRRVRPDRERIVDIVVRNELLAASREDVLKELSKAVEEEAILKIKYKDGYSYRNPSKSTTRGAVVNRTDTPAELSFAISQTLRKLLPDASSPPIAMSTLINVLRTDFPTLEVQDEHVSESVEEEVTLGNCVRLDNGLIGPAAVNGHSNRNSQQLSQEKQSPSAVTAEPDEPSSSKTMIHEKRGTPIDVNSDGESQSSKLDDSQTQGQGRVSQRKRVKKNLDPDFLDPMELNSTFTKKSKVSNTPSTTVVESSPIPVVKESLGIIDRRSKEYRDCLLKCNRCRKKGAPDALIPMETLVALRNLRWKCNNCLAETAPERMICAFCRQTGAGFTCSSCVQRNKPLAKRCVFHYKCLFVWPNYEEGKYFCPKCYQGIFDDDEEEGNGEPMEEEPISDVTKPLNGDASDAESHDSGNQGNLVNGRSTSPQENGEENQDAQQKPEQSKSFRERKAETWTVDEVVEFLRSTGFENEAAIFREQEIDGKSLLLLKREDVLKGLGIKVGPALKIFSFITHLQNCYLVTPRSFQ